MAWWKAKNQKDINPSPLAESNVFQKEEPNNLVKEFSPQTYEEVEIIANALVARKSVKLNLENTIIGDRRRIIDFLCGIAYVLDLDIKKHAVDIYEFKLNG
ncbi:MAG: cell division protein SepF [Spiroplasma sp.]|nr:cell division protein SepF [Spiroplasma sp.]